MLNMRVIVAAGEKFNKAEVHASTDDGLAIGEELVVEIFEYFYIAVMPLAEENFVWIDYIEENEVHESHALSEQDEHLLKELQTWITIGGLSGVAFIILILCFLRRCQRWKELQAIIHPTEEHTVSTKKSDLSVIGEDHNASKKHDSGPNYAPIAVATVA